MRRDRLIVLKPETRWWMILWNWLIGQEGKRRKFVYIVLEVIDE